MNQPGAPGQIQMIPINQIDIMNPRERNHRVFDEIISNIKTVGADGKMTHPAD